MVDTKLCGNVMSYLNENDYIKLKEKPIRYTNVTTAALFVHLYDEYGEKTEALQNKALDDLEEDVNISGASTRTFKIKQDKLQLFLEDTEQAVSDGIYITKYLKVIKQSNFINKDVLKWRVHTLAQQTLALFWPHFKDAHTK